MPNLKANYYEFTTAPSGTVVDIALVKENANITFNSSDTLIQFYIDTAVERIEQVLNRILRPAVMDGFYSYPAVSQFERGYYVPIEKSPIQVVNEVAFWDVATAGYVALPVTDYKIEKKKEYWRIIFEEFVAFNNLDFTDVEPYLIRVGFDVGYPTSADIPFPIRLAVMQYATWLWENRGDCSDCAGCTSLCGYLFPSSIADLLGSYRIRRVFA